MNYSLLVPCYNAEAYIEGFLQNISQLHKPFDEIIFYDDASTDNSAGVLEQSGYRVIKGTTNKGPGYARNKLAASAAGEWLHFHDIDDYLLPDYLTKTASMAETGDYDVILCNVDWYEPDQKVPLLRWQYQNDRLREHPASYCITHPIGGINGLYNRQFFLQTGGFHTGIRIWEDADIHVRLADNGARFFVIEEVLSVAVRYHNSASVDQTSGWLTRLELLKNYAGPRRDPASSSAIGTQAQFTASKLILCKKYKAARTALYLSERCKVTVPVSAHFLWRLLTIAAPAWLRIELRLLQLQIAFRKTKND